MPTEPGFATALIGRRLQGRVSCSVRLSAFWLAMISSLMCKACHAIRLSPWIMTMVAGKNLTSLLSRSLDVALPDRNPEAGHQSAPTRMVSDWPFLMRVSSSLQRRRGTQKASEMVMKATFIGPPYSLAPLHSMIK